MTLIQMAIAFVTTIPRGHLGRRVAAGPSRAVRRRYRDLPLGTVDASVVTTAERLGIAEIATVDRRHFTVVRPKHVGAFTLLL